MRHSHTRRNGAAKTPIVVINELRQAIASNLGITPERIRYGKLGRQGKLGTSDPHWLIYYQHEWRELPWHFNGPTHVSWEQIRQWHSP